MLLAVTMGPEKEVHGLAIHWTSFRALIKNQVFTTTLISFC